MKRTKIEWADYSWNPLTGCLHQCEYCYAERMTKRFSGDVRVNLTDKQCNKVGDIYILDEPFVGDTDKIINYPYGFAPTFHRYRLDWPAKIKNGSNIFIGSMADMFGEWMSASIVNEVFEKCEQYSQHNYLFLTKSPKNYRTLIPFWRIFHGRNIHKNIWLGTTVTSVQDVKERGIILQDISEKYGINTFLSIEPILESLDTSGFKTVICKGISWVIIGAETGNRKERVIPKYEWIEQIVKDCDSRNIPIFMKDSLVPIVGEENMRCDFPEQLRRKQLSEKMRKKLYDTCIYCKKELPMKEMTALLYRKQRGKSAKRIGYACDKCFDKKFGDVVNEKMQLQNDA